MNSTILLVIFSASMFPARPTLSLSPVIHQPTPSEPLKWFCVRAQPKRENIAAAGLTRTAELEVFCPKIRFKRSTKRGMVWFVEALFPGYFFARFDLATHRRQVASSHGVVGLVQFGGEPASIPDSALETLRQSVDPVSCTVEIPFTLEVGATVELSHGPFQGFEAVIQSYRPATERVKILIELLGRTVETEAPIEFVRLPAGRAL